MCERRWFSAAFCCAQGDSGGVTGHVGSCFAGERVKQILRFAQDDPLFRRTPAVYGRIFCLAEDDVFAWWDDLLLWCFEGLLRRESDVSSARRDVFGYPDVLGSIPGRRIHE